MSTSTDPDGPMALLGSRADPPEESAERSPEPLDLKPGRSLMDAPIPDLVPTKKDDCVEPALTSTIVSAEPMTKADNMSNTIKVDDIITELNSNRKQISGSKGASQVEAGKLLDGTAGAKYEKSYESLMQEVFNARAQSTLAADKRIALLEERCAKMEKILFKHSKHEKASSADKQHDDMQPELPPKLCLDLNPELPPKLCLELNPEFWASFKWKDKFLRYNKPGDPDHKGSPSYSPPTHVIDILVGEPDYGEEIAMKRDKHVDRLMYKSGPASDKLELNRVIEDLRGQRMPSLVRFNSAALQHLLQYFFWGAGGDRPNIAPGLVMICPFKPLIRYDADIRQLKDRLLSLLRNIRSSTVAQSERQGFGGFASVDGEASSLSEIDFSATLLDKTTWLAILKELDHLGILRSVDHKGESVEAGYLPSYDLASEVIASEWPSEYEVQKTFDCLLELMDSYIAPIASSFRNRKATEVRFSELWHVFQSGDEVISWSDEYGVSTILRVLQTYGGRVNVRDGIMVCLRSSTSEEDSSKVPGINPFAIHAWYIGFDGTALTPIRKRFVIQPYDGVRSIAELEVYPVEYVSDLATSKSGLIARGKKFVHLANSMHGVYYDCNGVALNSKKKLRFKVIVDMKRCPKAYNAPDYTEPDDLDVSKTAACPFCISGGGRRSRECTAYIHDWHVDIAATDDYKNSHPMLRTHTKNRIRGNLDLTDDDYALCDHRVPAFHLKGRGWTNVPVHSLQNVSDDREKGFERLVLPDAHKHVIKSQVKEHFRKRGLSTTSVQDELDLVPGKGQGLIILLHGAPGVGKTCTAETIADLVCKPLYAITCGDLGSTVQEVEEGLKKHFTAASEWDCVLLIDEADVFMAKRKPHDLQRNSIVSVFLRMLEYYNGLLFLTTNRVGSFDEAFKSRVHISLFYPDFDRETTIKVWQTFIDQTKESIKAKGLTHFKVRTKGILAFAAHHWEQNPRTRWNGRQIRNAFHNAIAMAEFDARENGLDGEEPSETVLSHEQFAKIAETVEDFDKYMIETMGVSYEEQAKKSKLRHPGKRGETKRRERAREELSKQYLMKSGKKFAHPEEESDWPSMPEDLRGKKGKGTAYAAMLEDSESEEFGSDSGDEERRRRKK